MARFRFDEKVLPQAGMPLLSIVLPTYREAGHIQELLQAISDACRAVDCEILVVDDDSPDGTHQKVLEFQERNSRVVPILRTHERGLATAVIEGLRRSRGEYVVVMDSDFQHPPATVPKLLEIAQRTGSQLVVASRYAPGGSVSDFRPHRRFTSWAGKMLAVLALPRVRKLHITDPMSGFFLVRRDAVDPAVLEPLGYKILIEVLTRANIARAAEVGFAFDNRRSGESKLRLGILWDYFRHVLRLGLQDRENKRVLRGSPRT